MNECRQCSDYRIECDWLTEQHQLLTDRLTEAERSNHRLLKLNSALIDSLTVAIRALRHRTSEATRVADALTDVLHRWPIDHITRDQCERLISQQQHTTDH